MKKRDLSPLFALIESHLDMKQVEEILLVLEKDKVDFDAIHEVYIEEKKEISLFEKINPFSEREQKGKVLKLKVQLEDIAGVYKKDRKVLLDMAATAIHNVPAFVAKGRHSELKASIEEIWASGPKGASVHGKGKAQSMADELSKSFIDIYGDDFAACPKLSELLSGYMHYLFQPFHLPQELDF